jgi:hypothetical protein
MLAVLLVRLHCSSKPWDARYAYSAFLLLIFVLIHEARHFLAGFLFGAHELYGLPLVS